MIAGVGCVKKRPARHTLSVAQGMQERMASFSTPDLFMNTLNPGNDTAAVPSIIVERHLGQSPSSSRANDLQLCLDEKDGECHGYVVTVCLPASYLSRVSRVRLQSA